ncbi:f-actin-capping protein subunit alpha [Anaeramoeba ignava]|uniref:F-actin-capping protein subunit alpha n=1 Tax=Anaeramoeba ignava TaxID=1746090 RepID=A0A9Q0R6D2_ANAIG|nr:f-actin-capping protein subunit alpha [Anaeramoeba ignava]|eukprot:Anaeramoba_ignava/a347908_56.p1 GENE.a347908_56~~a347908_56.p1  ORF type:complete len:281 (-),score=78.49 a347908_56:621-1463(-)
MELTEEEKLRILSHFLLSSPPGEFSEVLTDVRVCLQDDDLLNQAALPCFKQFNHDQMIEAELTDLGYNVLITDYGESETDFNYYLDPRSGKYFEFDHLEKRFTGNIGKIQKSSDIRDAIDFELNDYCISYYPQGTVTVYEKPDKIIICISAFRFSPDNFWNGRWRSIWQLEGISKSKATLNGFLKVECHYYEDGNVQSTIEKQYTQEIDMGDQKSTATNVVQAIKELEQKFQQSLEEQYQIMGDTTFKSLRRKLPITGTKVEFANILAYRVTSEMSGDQI